MDDIIWSAGSDLVAPGGPSAPVWGFLTTILLGVCTLIYRYFNERAERRETLELSKKAAEHAEAAVDNTKNISNGFARGVNGKLDTILAAMQDIDGRLNEHIAQHDRKEQTNADPQ